MDPVMLALAKSWVEKEYGDLRPLIPNVGDIEDLLALHPHIASILDSRIVDHNLDVTDPPNGWYVRYANGLAEFVKKDIEVTEFFNTRELRGIWNPPASAVEYLMVMYAPAGLFPGADKIGSFRPASNTSLDPRAMSPTGGFVEGDGGLVRGWALVRWM